MPRKRQPSVIDIFFKKVYNILNSLCERKNDMKIKILALLTAVFALSSSVLAASSLKVNINGEELITDPPAMVESDRALVPMRAIFEKLGASVIWDGEKRSVVAAKGDSIILLQIDNTTMFVNSEKIELEVAPIIVKDRTLVPLKAVSEALGVDVKWEKETNEVNVNY